MQADSSFISVGKIVKAHGTKGEVVIAPEHPDLADPEQETLFIKNFAGDFLPYKVEEAILRQKSSRYSFFVKFARIDNRTASDSLVGSEVFKYDETVEPAEETSLTGYDVFDENGAIFGKVIAEMFTPAHPLIEISHVGGNLLLPFVDEYIVDHLPEQRKVIVKNLDRFLE